MHTQFCLLKMQNLYGQLLSVSPQLLTQQFSQSKVSANYFLSMFKSKFHLTFQLLKSQVSNNYN